MVLLRNAWFGDDTFIILRTVDNFVNGYGLRWNVAERVQSFTSPLWTLLLIPFYFVTKEPLFTTTFITTLCSLLALWAAIPKKQNTATTTLIFAVALSTPAFVFYAVSGLENPLIFLLLGLFFNEYLGAARLGRMTLLFSLLVMTRHDLSLVGLIPLLDVMAKRSEKGDWLKALPGLLPIILWELFSVIYYGSLVPNTAAAKLPIDYPKLILISKGFEYIFDTLDREPLTILTVTFGLMTPFIMRSKNYYITAASIALYCCYVVVVGGDFMAGRFFGPPFWISLILIAHATATLGHRIVYSIALGSIALGFLAQHPTLPEDSSACCGSYAKGGTADEKQFYYPGAGFLKWRMMEFWPGINSKMPGREYSLEKDLVITHGAIGMSGYLAGPTNHFIDIYALTDPFLSQLEPRYVEPRAGHFMRDIPAGYYESIKNNSNEIKHPTLRRVYSDISLITRGEIFSAERFRAILDKMFGVYKPLIRKYSRDIAPKIPATSLAYPKENKTDWDAPGVFKIPDQGLRITFKELCRGKKINLSLDHNNTYLVRLIQDGSFVQDRIVKPFMEAKGLIAHDLKVSKPFNEIALYNMSEDRLASIGHLITDSECK